MPRCFALAVVILAAACSRPSLDDLRTSGVGALQAGRLADAERFIAQGIERTAETPQSPDAWHFRLLSAEVQMARVSLSDAEQLLTTSMPEGLPAEIRGRQRFLTAKLQVLRGDPKSASALLEQARADGGADRALRFDIDVLAGQLRFMAGRWGEAEEGLLRLVDEASAAGDPHHQAQALNNLGMGLVVRGRFDEALLWFEQVIGLGAVEGTTVYGQSLNNAGICLARLGQFERAIAYQQKAIAIHKNGRQLDYAQALGELGSTYFLHDDVKRGMSAWEEALSIARGADLSNEAVLWARNLAQVSAQLADWDSAERYNDEATKLAPTQIGSRRAYAIVIAATIAGGRGRYEEARRLYDEALAASAEVPAVRWMSYGGLANLAAAQGRPDEAARHFESAVQTVEQTRSSLLRADYRISFPSRLMTFYRSYVDLLLAEGHVERALEVADASRARVLAERQGLATGATRATARSLQQLARATRATFLFYWLGANRSWAWTVTGDRIQVTELPASAQIEALVTEQQTAIQNALADPLTSSESAGERLYRAVIAPLRTGFADTVVIVPDGALHRVNFETLIVPDGPEGTVSRTAATESTRRRYWIEDVTVQIAPSLAMLQTAARPSSAPSLLLVGNAAARPPEFPALTHAAAEMSAVRKHFAAETVTVVDGGAASPAAFKAAAPERFSAIHFTSHAIANTESPLDSAVILSGPDQAYKLYARDVAALPLTSELVTVSACRSAGERAYAGEGLVGFAWAFLRAGSRRVVAGLWDVDDRSTAALMEQMYARIAAGDSPPAALREAKRALIRNGYPKPYYWAPFQMFSVVI
jgi:CHAT domain-containing protein/Tfp pilus assembly protein PilF